MSISKTNKTPLFTLLLIFFLSGIYSFEVKAEDEGWHWDKKEDFTATYDRDKGCFAIRIRICYHNERSGEDRHANLRDAIINVKDNDKGDDTYIKLFKIDMDDTYEKGEGYICLQSKNASDMGTVWYEDTELISGYSEDTGYKIKGAWPSKNKSTYKTIFWYPDASWVGKTVIFSIRDGKWEIRGNPGPFRFEAGDHTPVYTVPQKMTNKLNPIRMTRNEFKSNGNNSIQYSISNYIKEYDNDGTVYLMRWDPDGKKWQNVDSHKVKGASGEFEGVYFNSPDMFAQDTKFKIEFRAGNTHYASKTIFIQETDEMYSPLVASVKGPTINQSSEGKDITVSWSLGSLPPDPKGKIDESRLEVRILPPNKTSWNDVESHEVKYTDREFVYTLPAEELETGTTDLKNYRVMVRRLCFDMNNQWGTTFQKTATKNIHTHYQKITNFNAEGKNGVLTLSWERLADGIWVESDLEYKLYVNDDLKVPPGIDKLSHELKNLPTCEDLKIELQLVQKVNGKIISNPSTTLRIAEEGESRIENLTVSKGYSTDKVTISWEIPRNASTFTDFEVRRKPSGAPAEEEGTLLVQIPHTSSYYSIEDTGIDVGEYYTYTVTGFLNCGTDRSPATYKSDIGYAQSYGTVSGRITFTGSQAVPDVDVIIEGDGVMENKALEFTSESSTKSYVSLPPSVLNNDKFTFQVWVNPRSEAEMESEKEKTILYVPNLLNLNLEGDKLAIYTNSEKIGTTGKIEFQEYSHISLVFERLSKDAEYADIKLYVGDQDSSVLKLQVDSLFCGNFDSTSAILIGNSSLVDQTTAFNGYMDEIRFWNIALTEEQINTNYDRFLNGKEDGLTAYYRCDENEVANRNLYDSSAIQSLYNKRDADLGEGVSRTKEENEVPSSVLLSNKGRTDKDGNFLINTIPYGKDGNSYTLTPLLDTHNFTPVTRSVFISPASSVTNGMDFTDTSSFLVSGNVYYEGTNVPVEKAMLTIDGTYCVKDGQLVYTDENGYYEIEVPIGSHFISVVKEGHTFRDNGQYPPDPNGTNPKITFDHNMENLDFYDTTTITVVGRVAGGVVEEDKIHALGEGIATIGQATIVLEPLKEGYNLNKRDSTFNYSAGNDHTETTAWTEKGSDKITIVTDRQHGEFIVKIPAISMRVVDVFTKRLDKSHFDIADIPNINLLTLNAVYTDTLFVKEIIDEVEVETGEVSDTVSYHHAMDIIYRSTPTFNVWDRDSEDRSVFGEKEVDFTDPWTGETIPVPAYEEKTEGIWEYNYGYPIFLQQKTYYFEMEAYEEYVNYDDADEEKGVEAVSEKIPLQNAVVSISNEMGSMTQVYFNSKEKEDGILYQPEEGMLTLNAEGKATYAFTAGLPNINEDHTWGMNIQYTSSRKKYEWDGNENFRGSVFGKFVSGNEFVTHGPDLVHFILRDPPGSNSSTFIEEGSTHTITRTSSGNLSGFIGMRSDHKRGIDVQVVTPGTIMAAAARWEHFQNATGTVTWNHREQETRTTKTTRRISTSNSPLFVGAEGDVFFGVATNTILGEAQEVGLVQDTLSLPGVYAIGLYNINTMRDSHKTDFVYSAKHIETELIPQMITERNKLLSIVDSAFYANYDPELGAYKNNTKDPIYITCLSENDPRFGSNNDDKTIWGDKASEDPVNGPSYIMIDPEEVGEDDGEVTKFMSMVSHWNSQVELWRKYLAQNERQKLEAIESNNPKVNYSFDSGSFITETNSKVASDASTHTVSYKVTLSGGYKKARAEGGILNENVWERNHDYGTVSTLSLGLVGGGSESWGNTKEESVTFGYTLADSDVSNYFSVDVYYDEFTDRDEVENIDKDKSEQVYVGNSPIFRTRGGQSSCPYEGKKVSKYYLPGRELSSATLKIHVPQIQVNNPFANDIPAGKEATYKLSLNNNSEAGIDYWYNIRVEKNPHGAVIMMDGAPLTAGRRDIFIKAGTTLEKTLQLRQSDESTLVYDSIQIVLSSNCSGVLGDRESDFVYLFATFRPTCTDLDLGIEDRIVNTETTDTLLMVVKGYQTDYEGFKAIKLQYIRPGDRDWSLIQQYVPEGVEPEFNDLVIPSGGEIKHYFNMHSYPDGEYTLRALSVCDYGEGDVECESEEITIYKDMSAPKNLGTPTPSDGILTPDSEISVVFNEAIQNEILNGDNFSITGVLNGYQLTNGVGLQFDGKGQAYTDAQLTHNNNFSIETWFQREVGKAGTLFAYGSDGNYIALGFTADNYLTVTTQNAPLHKSTRTIADTDWQYVSLSYDRLAQRATVYLYSAEYNSEKAILEINNLNAPTRGRLYLGSTPGNGGDFVGKARQVHFWSTARNFVDIADKGAGKSGKERGLNGYWTLEEGNGDVAIDKSRGRNLVLHTDWFVEPGGKAVSLNGTSDYVTIPSARYPFSEDDDFTVEFWLKGEDQEGTLMALDSIAIVAQDNGSLALRVAGQDKIYNLTEKRDILDGEWHHFAMSAKRGGSILSFIDGNQAGEILSSPLGRFAADSIYFGANYNVTEVWVNEEDKEMGKKEVKTATDFFAGSLDEIRIWNSALNGEQINLNRGHRLRGTETGLKAYYPFETYTQDAGNQWIIEKSMTDKVDSQLFAVGPDSFTDNTPGIKDARPVEEVTFDWTASNEKIVLDIKTPVSKIENTILTISVDGVKDVHGNKMASPLQWTAYVNLNRLQWDTNQLDLEKQYLEQKSFTTTISNLSGVTETYRIEGLPVWLSCKEAVGTVQPLKQKDITFVINETLPIGSYEATLTLAGMNEYQENLLVTLNVFSERPEWSVDTDMYETSMIICAKLKIEDIFQEDENDIVAAFINGECRGVGSPQYAKLQNSYYLILNVFGNSEEKRDENGKIIRDNISFRVWDASTGNIYTRVETEIVEYIPSAVKGSIADPVILNAKDIREQRLNLHKGWNWVSFNVKRDDILSPLTTELNGAGLEIKYIDSYARPGAGGWYGPLVSTGIDVKKKYRINLSNDAEVTLDGGHIDPADKAYAITIYPGWNWIAYLPNTALPLNVALAGLDSKNGDELWAHTGFAVYMEEVGWIGNIPYMQSGVGYMYKNISGEEKVFNYPSLSSFSNNMRSDVADPEYHWTVDFRKYPTNMTMTAVVFLDGGQLLSEDMEIGVFTEEGVCRGRSRLVYEPLLDDYLLYLMIYGETGDIVKFRVYDHEKKDEIVIKDEYMTFTSDKSVGSPSEPYELRLYDIKTGIGSLTNNAGVYPNPVKDYAYIALDGLTIDKYSIVDLVGKIIKVEETIVSDAIDMTAIAPGVYFLNLYFGEQTKVFKVVKE